MRLLTILAVALVSVTASPFLNAQEQTLPDIAAADRKSLATDRAKIAAASGETAQPRDPILDPLDEAAAAADNKKLCDQVITVAGWTPKGLALYIPPIGQRFMAKNSSKYPRMCLEQTIKEVPGVPRYLLVYSYDESAFRGFQSASATAPIPGSGTLSDFYGHSWNFTYSGNEIDTIELPYVIRSRSLYLNAYFVQRYASRNGSIEGIDDGVLVSPAPSHFRANLEEITLGPSDTTVPC